MAHVLRTNDKIDILVRGKQVMEKKNLSSPIVIMVVFAILCLASAVFALDPRAPTRVRVGVDVPPGVLLFDGQDYNIPPNDTSWLTKIRSAGWSGGKAMNTTGTYPPVTPSNGNGYFYTVTSTPGINKTIPGNGVALAVESWSGTVGQQTDFYLQYGSESDNIGKIPAAVWFQFWILAETNPSWKLTGGGKFICPT